MLHYFIANIVLPKHSNHSQISDMDLQIIYAIKNRIKVNWADLIMFYMLHRKGLHSGLPYGRLITKILKFCDIELKREPKMEMTTRACEISVSVANKTHVHFQICGWYLQSSRSRSIFFKCGSRSSSDSRRWIHKWISLY